MPYGHTARPCRVYQYGCRPPLTGEDAAMGEMRRRVTFWNRLVEIERAHQAAIGAVLAELAPDVALAEAAVARWEADKETVGEERATALKAAWKARQAARRAAFARDDVKARVGDLETARKATVKAAYHDSGLYWPNYNDVLAAYGVARRQPGELRFHSWRQGEGKLSMAWPTGLPVTRLLAGGDNMLQIDPVPEAAWTSPIRGERRRLSRTVVRLRIGSERQDGARPTPIWLELPVVLHRPLPAGGLVRQAAVLRERVGAAVRWKLVLTVELPADEVSPVPRGEGRIGIDVGWRKTADGLRIAAWSDDLGRTGEVVLPAAWLSEMGRVEDLQSLRDQHVNAIKAALGAWVKAAPGVPAWLRENVRTLAQWRAAGRLVALERRWRVERFAGDDAGYQMLSEWARRDLHLWEWESHLRDQLIRQRRERYRVFAADVVRRYREVVMEAFDLRPMARRDQAATDLPGEARHMRQWAAVSVFREAVKNACRREGVGVREVDARNTTRECPDCGAIEEFDAAASVYHTCGVCGRRRDQDLGAARILLMRSERGSPASGEIAEGSRATGVIGDNRTAV